MSLFEAIEKQFTTADGQVAFYKSSLATILIADDDELTRVVLSRQLKAEGYTVLTATEGREVLELLRPQQDSQCSSAIDLLILDLMLPGVNGLDICHVLREQQDTIPILIISVRDSELDRVVALEVGADDYLAKPVGMSELVARCRALLRRSCRFTVPVTLPVEPRTLVWREIHLDLDAHQVTVRGQEIALTPKEFRLLKLLMQHPHRIWSREQLLDRVWGEDFYGDRKTVDVHIRWLREKLERHPSHPEYLQTVRGLGYRLG